jgi:hypothetical protein
MLACLLLLGVFLAGEPASASALAQEIGAIQQVRTLLSAQTMYYSQFGRYATKLEELGPPAKGSSPSGAAADLIPADLAGGVRNGYRFTLAGSATAFTIHADPLKYPETGRRSFFSDESLVIRQNRGAAPATAASPEVE